MLRWLLRRPSSLRGLGLPPALASNLRRRRRWGNKHAVPLRSHTRLVMRGGGIDRKSRHWRRREKHRRPRRRHRIDSRVKKRLVRRRVAFAEPRTVRNRVGSGRIGRVRCGRIGSTDSFAVHPSARPSEQAPSEAAPMSIPTVTANRQSVARTIFLAFHLPAPRRLLVPLVRPRIGRPVVRTLAATPALPSVAFGPVSPSARRCPGTPRRGPCNSVA